MANRISVILDVIADKATASVKGFRQSINDADGAVGKFKAGGQAAFATLQAHAAQFALAAGAAIVGFGVKSVAMFQETALEAGQLRDALGLSAEEASRLNEVASDLGIGTGSLEATIGKMNRTASQTPAEFDKIGAAIVRNRDGTVDINETFLATVDALGRIPDATARAEAAQKIFGRSWQDIAELVGMGADDIRAAMDKVSDAKLIDDAEIAKARKTREQLDKLKDSVEDLALEFGENLGPAVNVATDVLAGIAPVVGKVAKFVGDAFVEMADGAYWFGQQIAEMVDALPFVDMAKPIDKTLYEIAKLERATPELVARFAEGKPTMEEFAAAVKAAGVGTTAAGLAITEYRKQLDAGNESVGELTSGLMTSVGVIADTTDATDDLTRANDLLARKIDETTDRYRELKGELSAEEAFHNAEAMWADLRTSAEEAYTAAATGSEEAAQKAFDHKGAVIDAKQAVVELGEKYAELPEEEVTRVVALIDEGKLAEAEAAFNNLVRDRTLYINLQTRGGGGTLPGINPATGKPWGVGATGGIVTRPTLALIGEAGPEAVVPLNRMPGASPLPNGNGVAANIHVTVNAGIGANGKEVGDVIVDVIRQYERRNGTAWRS